MCVSVWGGTSDVWAREEGARGRWGCGVVFQDEMEVEVEVEAEAEAEAELEADLVFFCGICRGYRKSVTME